MKVTCVKCKKVLNIPDDRIPVDRKIAFPCPTCKGMIEIDTARDRNNGEKGQNQTSKSSGFLTGEALKKQIVQNVSHLPPMPQTVLKAREIIADPDSDFKRLGNLLETDQAVAARVLSLANSAYYGLSGRVSSIQHASVVLGHKALGELITMGGAAKILGNNLEGYGLDAGQLWKHSLGVAFGSRIIANRKNPALANDAFTSGLLHDSGKLILDPYLLERKEAFRKFIEEGQDSFLTAEKNILQFDHAEIAYEICKAWRLPDSLTRAIRYHHSPSKSGGDELCYIVHVADGISLMAGLGLGIDGMMYQFEDDAMAQVGLEEDQLGDIMEQVLDAVEKILREAPRPKNGGSA